MLIVYSKFNKLSNFVYNNLSKKLPASRVDKLKQKVDPIDKQICIIEYFLVKKLLKLKLNEDFSYNENGKPFITGKKHFSIAHCDDVLCVCASNREIGVDIQKIEYNQGLAKLICLDAEYKAIEASKNKAEALTTLFTKKESAIKCLGLNLTYIKDILFNHKFKFKTKKHKNHIITTCTLK